jgi:hypothetical protein
MPLIRRPSVIMVPLPGDLLSIEGFLGVQHSGRMFTCPLIKSRNRTFQRLAEFGEGVFDTHRRLRKKKPHQATSFKLSQALREHLLRYTRHTPLQHVKRALPSWSHNAFRMSRFHCPAI